MSDGKLRFHRHVEYLHSQALELLGLSRFIAYNFSSLDSLNVLCYLNSSVVWSNFTYADSNRLENIQRKFANVCYNRFIQSNSFCNYEPMLNYLHFKTLYSRRQNLDASFLINVLKNKIDCYSIMDTVGLRVPTK
jgi:hypothetical protein